MKKNALNRNKIFKFPKKRTNSFKSINKNIENKVKVEEIPKASADERTKKLEELYIQARQEYSNLFKDCPEALVYTDIDGIILTVNRCFEDLTGFQEEEIKHNSIVYCLRPEERKYFETVNKEYFETSIVSKNNYWIEVAVRRTINQIDNRLAGIIFSFQEISHLRRERKIIQTLYKISQIANMDVSLLEIYPLIHEQLGQIINATNFYIALTDTKQGGINFPYYTDVAAGDDEIFINRYCTSQSIFHYVLKIGKPVLMDFQRYRKMLSYGYIEPWDVMTNTHLWLAVPLKAGEKIIGVIALQSYDNARLYTEKDIDLLEFVSQQLSTAIYKKALQVKITKMEQDLQETGSDKNKAHLDMDEQPLKEPTSPLSKDNSENMKQVNENVKDN
jgi:PAS domain S-box-containing protein